MAQWLVMQGDNKFPVDSLADIEALARRGRLKAADMIQPPGTTEWLYATEVPELKALLDSSRDDDDDDVGRSSMVGGAALAAVAGVLGLGFVAVIAIGGGATLYYANQMQGDVTGIIGEGGLAYSEMIVTSAGAGLRNDPDKESRIVASVEKDSVLELLAKRGEFYRARNKSGAEGWIPTNQVIPMYQLGSSEVKQDYDPLYNPDAYVDIENATWMLLPPEKRGEVNTNVTTFEIMISNKSKYPMTDIRLLATIKDGQGHELEKIEIPIEGVLPANDVSFIGTLAAEAEPASGRKKPKDPETAPDRILTTWSFERMIETEPELQMRWTSGIEVLMKTESFASAEVDVIELRAVPDKEATAVVRKE